MLDRGRLVSPGLDGSDDDPPVACDWMEAWRKKDRQNCGGPEELPLACFSTLTNQKLGKLEVGKLFTNPRPCHPSLG